MLMILLDKKYVWQAVILIIKIPQQMCVNNVTLLVKQVNVQLGLILPNVPNVFQENT